jgi:GNAT superfamily N-acetyltransferase
MHGVAQSLNRLAEPHFLSLKEHDELVAAAVRSRKMVRVGENVYNAFHLALLAVDARKIGHGYGKLMVEQSRRHFLKEVGTRGLLYGYIEAGNTRSLALNQRLGYQPIGLSHTVMFSRLRPQDDARVGRLAATERQGLIQLLNEQYADHGLLDFEQSVQGEAYFVLRQGGEIIAGVQAEQLHRTIQRLPGASGRMMLAVLPRLPILRRLFAAKDCHLLRLGNVYARMGQEAALFTLIEALLAREHLHAGVAFVDKRSSVHRRIAAAGKFGLLNAVLGATLHVIADFNAVPEEEIAELRRRPLCISPIDVI